MDFSKFEKKIGVKFNDRELLKQAFTHRSYVNDHRSDNLKHNERLEYFGDAILGFVIADYLFKKFPDMDEEELTTMRAALINWETCAQVANKLGMDEFILMSKGVTKHSPKTRKYVLANTLEAIIGAIYIDQGFDMSKKFILNNIAPLSDDVIKKESWTKSPKSILQEHTQEKTSITPVYKVISESGPPHDQTFVIGVYLNDELAGRGKGKSKQDAEQEAARAALESKGWK